MPLDPFYSKLAEALPSLIQWTAITGILIGYRDTVVKKIGDLTSFEFPGGVKATSSSAQTTTAIPSPLPGLGELPSAAAAEEDENRDSSAQPPVPAANQADADGTIHMEPDDLALGMAIVARLTIGWRFERIYRIIFPQQLQLLLQKRDGSPFNDPFAIEFYNRMDAGRKKFSTYQQFMAFLQNQGLIHAYVTGEQNTYVVLPLGQQFLDHIQRITNDSIFPGIGDDPAFMEKVRSFEAKYPAPPSQPPL